MTSTEMNIYVGNLSYQMTDDELKAAFQAHGEVDSARIITDRDTGRSKGFGFVEMPDNDQALAAIEALNGSNLSDRAITVNEARPKPQRSSEHRSGGYGGGGHGGNRGNGSGSRGNGGSYGGGGGRNRY